MSAVDFVAGVCVGIVNVLIGHPLDTVKVCQQTDTKINWKSIRFLYRGATVPFVIIPFENAMVFGTYHNTKRFLQTYFNNTPNNPNNSNNTNNSNPHNTQHSRFNEIAIYALSGTCAGMVYGQFAAPLEYLKIRSQTYYATHSCAETMHTTPIRQLMEIFQSPNSVKTLFTGYQITVIRDMSAFAAQFTTYELCKQWLKQAIIAKNGKFANQNGHSNNGYNYSDINIDYSNNDENFHENLSTMEENVIYAIAGALGGIACWIASYPQDVIKSNMQQFYDINNKKNHTTLNTAKRIHKQFGVRGFYRGITACLIRVAMTDGAGFWVFENVKKLMNNYENTYDNSNNNDYDSYESIQISETSNNKHASDNNSTQNITDTALSQ